MQTLTDMAVGAIMWTIGISLFVGTVVFTQHFYGPPVEDRARVFALIVGGAMTTVLIAAFIGISVALYMNANK